MGIGTKWEMGNKYIYTLDFSEGAGKPEPDPENPEPNEPVDPILGGPIKFTVEVAKWIDKDQTPTCLGMRIRMTQTINDFLSVTLS